MLNKSIKVLCVVACAASYAVADPAEPTTPVAVSSVIVIPGSASAVSKAFGIHYAAHEMKPGGLPEGRRLAVSLSVTQGRTRKELGSTVKDHNNYASEQFVVATVHDGKAIITRWSSPEDQIGMSWDLDKDVSRLVDGMTWSTQGGIVDGFDQEVVLAETPSGNKLVASFRLIDDNAKAAAAER